MTDPHKRLRPVLSESTHALQVVHGAMTAQLCADYGQSTLARLACERLERGFAAYLEPLAAVLPRSWELLRADLGEAQLIETRTREGDGAIPTTLSPVFLVPGGFCTFRLYYGTGPSPNSDEENLAKLRKRLGRLPDGLQALFTAYEGLFFNDVSDLHQAPDVTLLALFAFASTPLTSFAKSRKLRTKLSGFDDLDELKVVSYDNRTHPFDWVLFIDNSPKGDQSVYAIADPATFVVRRLSDPMSAIDMLFAHFLGGDQAPFDFERVSTPL